MEISELLSQPHHMNPGSAAPCLENEGFIELAQDIAAICSEGKLGSTADLEEASGERPKAGGLKVNPRNPRSICSSLGRTTSPSPEVVPTAMLWLPRCFWRRSFRG